MTLIIFAGTFGVLKDLIKICDRVESIRGLQTIVVCGLNKKLFDKVSKKRYQNIVPMRYVSDIFELYEIVDFMITKPGGTVLSEIVQKPVPVILYNPTPGQELENALIFVKNGAAVISKTPDDILEQVEHLMKNSDIRNRMIQNQLKLNYGNSSKTIVEDSLAYLNKREKENDSKRK